MLSSATIANGLAALTVTGVTIKALTNLPEQVQARDCPILFPDPSRWMGGGNGEPSDGPATFGAPTDRLWQFNRTFRYVYLHAPVGSKRGILEHFPGMAANADAILTAIAESDISDAESTKDIMTVSIGEFSASMFDPANQQFYGFTLDITIREKVNP